MTEAWQVSRDAAEVYEAHFVPAIFGQWAPQIVAAAHVDPGERVLDVGCGTGIVARAAAQRAGPSGTVTGLDLNEGMLAVAQDKAPGITWRQGDAQSLPFEDASFDAVLSQFVMMFLPDRPKALKEMWRVLGPGGRLAFSVWVPFDRNPVYSGLAEIARAQVGDKAAEIILAPGLLGEEATLTALAHEAGLQNVELQTRRGKAVFPSFDALVDTEIKGGPLAEMVDEGQLQTLIDTARDRFEHYVTADGQFVCPLDARFVTARKTN